MNQNECCKYIFEHFVDLPSCECVFCSAKEEESGRRQLFLIFNDNRRIYIRNGKKDTWDELTDQREFNRVRDCFHEAILERAVPVFRSEVAV